MIKNQGNKSGCQQLHDLKKTIDSMNGTFRFEFQKLLGPRSNLLLRLGYRSFRVRVLQMYILKSFFRDLPSYPAIVFKVGYSSYLSSVNQTPYDIP